MNREAQILQALPLATAAEQRRLVAELTSIRQAAARRVQASREIELGDHIASAHLTPAPTYVRHSSDTNWLGEVTGTRQSPAQIHQAAKHEAAAWFRQTLPVARADKGELRRQAVGYAQAWSGQFLDRSGEAAEAFLQAAFHHAGLKLAKEIGYEDDDDYDADAEAPKEDDNDGEVEDDDDYFGPKKESRRRTASISMDDVQHWCDQNGCVMMDFPEELIESVVQSGDLEQLDSYLEDIDAGQIGQDGRDWDYGQSESASYGWTGSRRTAGEYYDDLGPGFTQNSFPQSEKREVARWSTKGGKMTLVLTHGQYGYDYDVFDRQWSSPRSSGSVNGSSDQEAIAEIEAQMARGWHDKGLSRVSTRRTAGEGMTCSVCGDKMASTDGSHHHDNGEKHDHEAKPGGDSKESARRTAAEAYDWRNWVGHAYMGFPGSKIISITPSEDYLMNGPRGTGPGHQAPATMVLQDGDRQLTIPIDLATAHRQVLGARRTALKCSCAHNNDGSVTTFLCPLHADDDPCATMASVTGGRRKGSIINGVCSNCGWTSDRTASKTAARRTSSLFDDADAAYEREDQAWFDALSMDDLVTLWNAVSGENFLSGVQTYGWDDEVSDALYAKGYDFGVTASRRTASTGQIVRDSGWSAPLKSLDGESQPRTRTLSVDALGQGKGNMLVTMSWFWPDYEIRVDPYPGAVVAKGQTASLGIIESAAMDWIKKNVTAEWYSSEKEKAIAQYASRKTAGAAYDRGLKDGKLGDGIQYNPYPAFGKDAEEWIRGYRDAQGLKPGEKASSRKQAGELDRPSEKSQNGYGESSLDQIEVADAPENTNLGWIDDGKDDIEDPWRDESRFGSRKVAWTIDDARKVIDSGSYATVDGTSALVQVFDAISPANQAKLTSMPLERAVDVVFQLANRKASLKTAERSMSEIAKAINDQEFDHCFTLHPDGSITDASGVWAPSVYNDDGGDITIDGSGWSAMTGLTGQYGYSGAVMHSSEYVGTGVAEAMMEMTEDGPVTFTMTTVEVMGDDPDSDEEPAGWAILYRTGRTAKRKTAGDLAHPSEKSQNGYGESALDQIEVHDADALLDTNLGWIADGDANADPEDSFDREASKQAAGEKVVNDDGSVTVDGKTYQPGSAMYQALMGSGPVTKGPRRQAAESNDRPAGAADMVDHTSDDPGYDHDMFGGEWVYEDEFGDGQPNSGDTSFESKPSLNATGSLVDDFDMFAPSVTKTAMPAPADMGIAVGDIFVNSWGYDQTNIDFYKVIRLTGAGAEVVPIGKKFVSQNGPGGNKVVPDPDTIRAWDTITGIGDRWSNNPDKKSKVCKVTNSGSLVLRSGEHWAQKWDGQPEYETDSQFGH